MHVLARAVTCAWLLLTLVLAGCGEKSKPMFDPVTEGAQVFGFTLGFEEALREGHITAGEDRAVLAAEVRATVSARLHAAGVEAFLILAADGSLFELLLPLGAPHAPEYIENLVTRWGTLAFRVEVKPASAYRTHPDGVVPSRPALWGGTEEEFAAFKTSEVARWRAATEAGEAYEPSRSGLRVVPEADWAGRGEEAFHLVEEPAPADRFGNDLVGEAFVGTDQMGQPVVLFEVPTARQAAFGAWTAANIGMPLGILIDGMFHLAPVIMAKLTSNVQITLGTGPRAELERQAKELTAILAVSPLKVRPSAAARYTRAPRGK